MERDIACDCTYFKHKVTGHLVVHCQKDGKVLKGGCHEAKAVSSGEAQGSTAALVERLRDLSREAALVDTALYQIPGAHPFPNFSIAAIRARLALDAHDEQP